MYAVKEIFLSMQGEGYHAGRVAIFCRFAGCNFWSGREEDRSTSKCQFCDTDFVGTDGVGGGRFASAELLVAAILSHWKARSANPFVILTGGEPLLQVRDDLLSLLHSKMAYVAVETNGSLKASNRFDWITVSPKMGGRWVQRHGSELKIVWPQTEFNLNGLTNLNFRHFFLQPKDGADLEDNTQACINECQLNPRWRLSIQTQKLIHVR